MRVIAGLAVFLLLPALAGCGAQSPTGSAARSTAANSNDAPFQYARCIRSHGVPSFPDPQVTTSPGSSSVRQMVPASVGGSPKFKSAQQACRGLLPGPADRSTRSYGHGPGPAGLLAFARCLRGHGLSGFPDPDRDGRITAQMISASGINLHTPVFLSAARACLGTTHGAISAADVLAAANHTS
jgi:hypothetical protein